MKRPPKDISWSQLRWQKTRLRECPRALKSAGYNTDGTQNGPQDWGFRLFVTLLFPK